MRTVTVTPRQTPTTEGLQVTFPGGDSALVEFIIDGNGQQVIKLSQVDPGIKILMSDEGPKQRYILELIGVSGHYDFWATDDDQASEYAWQWCARRNLNSETDVTWHKDEAEHFMRSCGANLAIKILAGQLKGDIDNARQILAAAVNEESTTGDPNSSLMDWIAGGDYTGAETVKGIAAEWDATDET